jgi:hypothetical protein
MEGLGDLPAQFQPTRYRARFSAFRKRDAPYPRNACRAYVDIREDEPVRILALAGSYLGVEDEEVFRRPQRGNFSRQ